MRRPQSPLIRYAGSCSTDMGLEVGIVGLPRSGKTTLFNALTRAGASVHDAKEHVGMAQIADDRLDAVARVERLAEGHARHHPRAGRAGNGRGSARQSPPCRRTPLHGRRLLARRPIPPATSSSSSWSCWWRTATMWRPGSSVCARRRSRAIRGCGRRRRRSRRSSRTSMPAVPSATIRTRCRRSSSR